MPKPYRFCRKYRLFWRLQLYLLAAGQLTHNKLEITESEHSCSKSQNEKYHQHYKSSFIKFLFVEFSQDSAAPFIISNIGQIMYVRHSEIRVKISISTLIFVITYLLRHKHCYDQIPVTASTIVLKIF